jgi:hypothetical protein
MKRRAHAIEVSIRTTLAICGAVFVAAAVASGADHISTGRISKYKVTAKADKHTDFSRLKTYAWDPGWPSWDPTADEQIIAAVERELAAVGFTKGTTETCDVKIVYAAVRRTDVNLKAKTQHLNEPRPSYPVGTLIVLILEPDTRKELFRARADTPVDLTSGSIEATIDSEVAQMFERYPIRLSDRR